MKRFLMLSLVIIATNIPFSCEEPCGPFKPSAFIITELDTNIGSVSQDMGEFNANTKATNYQEAAINFFIVDWETREIALQHPVNSFSFINQAFACTPPAPQETHKITKLVITGTETISFNGIAYEAGSDLKEAFNITNLTAGSISVMEAINLQNANPSLFGFQQENFIFQLKEAPDSPINQQLMFTIEFSDGSDFALETETFQVE